MMHLIIPILSMLIVLLIGWVLIKIFIQAIYSFRFSFYKQKRGIHDYFLTIYEKVFVIYTTFLNYLPFCLNVSLAF